MRGRGGVSLLAGLFLAALALRPQVVGVGPLLPAIRTDLGYSHAVAGLLGTIPVLCMGLFALPAGRLAHRVGARIAVAVALAAIGSFGILRAVVPGSAALIVLTLPVAVGVAVGNALMPAAVKKRFAARPGFATGVYATGLNLGSAVSSAVAVPVAHALWGWRAALFTFSAVTVGLASIWWWTCRDEPPHARPSAPPHELPWRSPLAWQLALVFALNATTFYGMNAWLPATYVERGWSESAAGDLVGLFNVVSVPAGLVVALVADRIGRRSYLVGGSVVYGGAILGVELVRGPGWAWFWAVSFGFGAGTLLALVMTLPLDVADDAPSVAAHTALMLGVGYSVAAVSPFALGAVRDATGSFSDALWLLVAAAAALSVAVATLSRERLDAQRGVRPGSLLGAPTET